MEAEAGNNQRSPALPSAATCVSFDTNSVTYVDSTQKCETRYAYTENKRAARTFHPDYESGEKDKSLSTIRPSDIEYKKIQDDNEALIKKLIPPERWQELDKEDMSPLPNPAAPSPYRISPRRVTEPDETHLRAGSSFVEKMPKPAIETYERNVPKRSQNLVPRAKEPWGRGKPAAKVDIEDKIKVFSPNSLIKSPTQYGAAKSAQKKVEYVDVKKSASANKTYTKCMILLLILSDW